MDTDFVNRVIYVQMDPGTPEQRRDEVADVLRASLLVDSMEVNVVVELTSRAQSSGSLGD